jgi:hypothetical protein
VRRVAGEGRGCVDVGWTETQSLHEMRRGVGHMTPDTVHLFAQLIRHLRGATTAFEQWTNQQPPSSTRRELTVIVATVRGILSSYEKQLSEVETDSQHASRRIG